MIHLPVLIDEVIRYLDPKPNENFIDGTFDGGGHAIAILEKTKPKGKVLGIELDRDILENLESLFQKLKSSGRLILINENFKNLQRIVDNSPDFKKKNINYYDISGILLDLGLSSWHLENSQKGFSFQRNENLDMRYDRGEELTARRIIDTWQESKIEKIIREYGEERYSRRIARAIIKQRSGKQIRTTFDLLDTIKKAIPRTHRRGKIHFATRTFQALRIAVNQELDNLKEVLPQTTEILKCGGRIVIISFNSLEDRIVKNFFKEEAKNNKIRILTKKPIRPTEKEIRLNPKARSAKLRTGEKICPNLYL